MRPEHSIISLVIPCFDEEENVGLIYSSVIHAFGPRQDIGFEVVFINDGSKDRTPAILNDIAARDDRVTVIHLSRNFGHQAAVSAGLSHAAGDAVIILDADMQDPLSVALEMVDRWKNGADIVFAIRTARKENIFKVTAYKLFYRVLKWLSSIDMPLDSGDFGLIDRKALNVMLALPEKNRFVRGLRAWVGFNQTGLVYERQPRALGEPKYNLRRLIKLAADGIFNFSATPLRIIIYLGMTVSVLTTLAAMFFLLQRIFDFSVFGVRSSDVPGFTSLALFILLLFGLNFIMLGVVGEYVGRIYEEVKSRPTYVRKEVVMSKYYSAEKS